MPDVVAVVIENPEQPIKAILMPGTGEVVAVTLSSGGGSGVSGYSGFSGGGGGGGGTSGYSGYSGFCGVFGGNTQPYNFDTSTVNSDPGSGNLRFDAALFASVNTIYADDFNSGGTDVSLWLANIIQNDRIVIYKRSDSSVFASFSVKNISVNAGGYYRIDVTPLSNNNGIFANSTPVLFSVGGGGEDGNSGFSGYSGGTGVDGASGYSGFSGGTGTNGASGYSGFSGPSGYSGFCGTGTSGFSGYSGAGTSGYSGYCGLSGYSGFCGLSGYSGFCGLSGYSGFSGKSGYSGFCGLSGYSGFSGPSGYSGFCGLSGYSGFCGLSGYSGFSGKSGYSGFSGDSAQQSGYSGYCGLSGYSGFCGLSGYSGFSGGGGGGTGVLTVWDQDLTLAANTSLVLSPSITMQNNHSLTIPSTSSVLNLGFTGGSAFSLSDALNSNVDISTLVYVPFLSKTTPTLSAGDTLIVEAWASILNNSGVARTYSYQFNVGSVAVMDTGSASAILNSATDRGLIRLKFVVAISASNLWYVYLNHDEVVASSAVAINTFTNLQWVCAWNTGTNDLTGSQTISLKVKSTSATATQTLTLHSYEIRRMPRQR